MVNTVKFSQFADANLTTTTNLLVGASSASGGINIKTPFVTTWTTLTRPSPPYAGLLGYNSTLSVPEFWNGTAWISLTTGAGTINPGLINQIAYYAASGDTLSGLPTGNNGVLVTNGSGVPSIGSTLPTAVQDNITRLGTQAENLNMGGFLINNVATPIVGTDAVNKDYADAIAGGLNPITGCDAASTVALTATYNNGASGVGATLTNAGAQAAFAIDGYTASLNDRILIKDQVSTFQNGIWIVTTLGSGATDWVLTRAAGYDTPTEIKSGDLVAVENGTVNAGSSWLQTATVTAVGTDPILFSAFFTPAAYLKVANNLSDVANTTTSRTNLSAAKSGVNSDITAMDGLTGPLSAPTAIQDSLGNNLLLLTYSASSVNYFEIVNSITGANPTIYVIGSDPARSLNIAVKNGELNVYDYTNTSGSGIRVNSADNLNHISLFCPDVLSVSTDYILPAVDGSANFILKTDGAANLSFANGSQIAGTATNDNASAGNIGELVSSIILQASSVSLTSTVNANITSISLTAGDWDVWGNLFYIMSGNWTAINGWIHDVSATVPDIAFLSQIDLAAGSAGGGLGFSVPSRTYSLAATTTIYLSAVPTFSTGTATACGGIYARRAR